MRALHLTFRFGTEVIGGAEYHFSRITRGLIEKGIQSDIYTTKTKNLYPISHGGVIWDNFYKKNETIENINIRRFSTISVPKSVDFIIENLIQRQNDREEMKNREFINDNLRKSLSDWPILGVGWNHLENIGNSSMRWTKKNAEIFFPGNIDNICFVAHCPKMIPGTIQLNGEKIKEFQTEKNWTDYKIKIYKTGPVKISLDLKSTWKPLRDTRNLGMAIKELKYSHNGEIFDIDLSMDYKNSFRQSGHHLELFISNAQKRPKIYSNLFMLQRGPNSPSMLYYLNKEIKNYDIIMAQMTPFNTVNYAISAGKKNKIPVVLMPLIHIDDEFYHWNHYYDAFKKADMILAMSMYSKDLFFDRLGCNSEFIGSGVDPQEFENLQINGTEFRKKLSLEGENIILFVGRKSGPKRYDLIINAVDILNERGINCKLVIIGPDEDNKPINSKNVVYVGKLNREWLIGAFDACDIFCNMSESESFGIVFLEAWMRKKPVIGNKHCGPVSYLIKDDMDGFLCEDKKDLSNKIEFLLNNNDLRKRMGKEGYKKVLENHTWDIITEKIEKIYEDLF